MKKSKKQKYYWNKRRTKQYKKLCNLEMRQLNKNIAQAVRQDIRIYNTNKIAQTVEE